MKTPESHIKDKIRAWLREQGAYVFSPTQMGYGQQTLDLLVGWRGMFVGIEIKAPGGKATKRQQVIMDEIRSAGCRAFVAWSLIDVIAWFKNHQ